MTVPLLTPTNPASVSWMAFEPCCGGNTLYFSVNGTTYPPNPGINIYNGISGVGYDPITDSYVGLNVQCYRIYRGDATTPGSPINASNYLNLNVVPTNFGGVYTWDSTTNYETPCGDEEITCPDCPTPLYVVWPCDGSNIPVVTGTDLSAYVNDYATITVGAGGFDCYYVVNWSVETNLSPNNPVEVIVAGGASCSCNCTCYEIVGSGKLYYIDCDGIVQAVTVGGYWKGCSAVYPQTTLSIIEGGECEDGECPAVCYELTDCAGLLDPIYTTAQSLGQYAILGQTVQIANYDNCWEVTSVVDCDCAINVVVLQAFDDCASCNPNPNYILTNCDDPSTIVYTSTDLSAYVGQVIQREPDCPGCWIVQEVNGPIPSDVIITVSVAFDDCEACKTTYYKLEDCTNIEADMITSTDLSAYVGLTIILDWCPTTCWTVSVSQTSANTGILGDIFNDFDTCLECLNSFPCICKRIKNHDTVLHNYRYVDCEGAVRTITLFPGERSDRICMKLLLTSFVTDYVETFGTCTDGECPPQIYPRRTVRPGYTTPICSTDKYEKITCKSAEILYKQVLNLRYGISNCCPDEDSKWLLKKEIIDLQALVDPDYTCTHLSCGCAPSTCSCGTTNSCNSH